MLEFQHLLIPTPAGRKSRIRLSDTEAHIGFSKFCLSQVRQLADICKSCIACQLFLKNWPCEKVPMRSASGSFIFRRGGSPHPILLTSQPLIRSKTGMRTLWNQMSSGLQSVHQTPSGNSAWYSERSISPLSPYCAVDGLSRVRFLFVCVCFPE